MSICKGSAGGKATAIIQRQNAINRYYSNPRFCLGCKKIIDVKDGQKVGEVKKKRFCNRSCAATYNGVQKSFIALNRHPTGECSVCKCKIEYKRGKNGNYHKRAYCPECLAEHRAKRNGADTYMANLTKDQIMKRYAKYYIGRNMIRRHAQKVFERSKKEKKCFICGYDKHIDVAHIKSVSDFSGDALVSEINDIKNLVGLCRIIIGNMMKDLLN